MNIIAYVLITGNTIKQFIGKILGATASFVRLEDLHQMVKDGVDFTVRDDKTGRDITASILAQIIAEEETKGHSVLPNEYLRQVLRAYSEGIGPQLATYLETAAGPCVVTQISGLVARRIVCWAAFGDRLAQGQRIGLIKLGSTTELYLPGTLEPQVQVQPQVQRSVQCQVQRSVSPQLRLQ